MVRAVIVSLLLAACSTAAHRDGEWRLANLPAAPPEAPRPTLSIAGQQLSGFAGCNRIVAMIESDPNVAAFFRQGPSATKMYCNAPGAMAMEQLLLDALNRTGDARVEGGSLVFFDTQNREIMRFVRAPE